MNNDVLALASCRSLRSVDVEMALMDHRSPVYGVDFLDHFSFVVVDNNVVFEGLFDLGQEVSMDNGYFFGSVCIFRLELETERDLLHFFIEIDWLGTGFGSSGRNVVIIVGRGGAVSFAS